MNHSQIQKRSRSCSLIDIADQHGTAAYQGMGNTASISPVQVCAALTSRTKSSWRSATVAVAEDFCSITN